MTIQLSYQRDASGQVVFDVNGNPVFNANTGANTYGAMQARIAYEVLGSPLASDVTNAIQDAIAQYERVSFWFNDMRYFGGSTGSASNLQTTLGQEFYSYADLPSLINYPHIDKISVLAFSNRYPLFERTPQWMEDNSISTTWQGMPTDWAWVGGGLRIYPVPNDTYPLIVSGTIRFAPLVNSSDYNCWTNEAEALIRFEAKRLLFTNVTRDSGQAEMMEGEIFGNRNTGRLGVLGQLRRETMRRTGGTGTIRPSRGFM